MAPKCCAARDLGHLLNLRHYHYTMCTDNDTPECPSTRRKELEADVAQDRLVITHDDRTGSSCIERMVGQAWQSDYRTVSHAQIAPQVAVP
jgi:hypothetical protein